MEDQPTPQRSKSTVGRVGAAIVEALQTMGANEQLAALGWHDPAGAGALLTVESAAAASVENTLRSNQLT